MSQAPDITLPLPEPLALLDATALFAIQVLLARHPELLAPPELSPSRAPRPLAHVSLLLDAVRDLQYAIEVYRSCLPHPPSDDGPPDDDIPF